MQITLRDVARRLKLDTSTVSLAMRPEAARNRGIPERRIRQIQRVAAEMGYRPNLSARNLRRGATKCIGVVMSYLDHYPLNHYFNLISAQCIQQGYYAVPLPMERSLDRNAEQLRMLESAHVDGLILLDRHRIANAQYQGLLAQRYPVVFRVHEPVEDDFHFPHVLVDRVAGYRELVRHLIGRGWSNIFVLTEADPLRPPMAGDNEHYIGKRLARGLREGMASFGVEIDLVSREICCQSRSAKHRYEATRQFLTARKLEPGTCILLDGGDGISGAYTAIAELGLRVGREVAVASASVPPGNEFVLPLPTCAAEPYDQVAATLVDLLLKTIGARGANGEPISCTFDMPLVPTDSAPDLKA